MVELEKSVVMVMVMILMMRKPPCRVSSGQAYGTFISLARKRVPCVVVSSSRQAVASVRWSTEHLCLDPSFLGD